MSESNTPIVTTNKSPLIRNNLKKYRENLLISKAELARRAGISPITLTRVEEGYPSRLDTKRKIIIALGLTVTDREKIFINLG